MRPTRPRGLTILVALTAVIVLVPYTLARQGANPFDQLALLVDVRHEIVGGYVEEPEQDKMIEAAVRGLVRSLDDPYTVFLTPEQLKPFDKQIRGSFSGIGAEIDIHENRLRIVSPLEESPAWKAGVMAGDIVLEIDAETTEDITISEAVERLTGPEGTVVSIRVLHESGEEAHIDITRARINVQTVKGIRRDPDHHWEFMLDPETRVGYIRITQFTGNTAEEVDKALDWLKQREARGLILDVRFNPGGMLESAVSIADMFLDQGKKIVSVKGRIVPERAEYATSEGSWLDAPLVILANEASASASEILTGALSDNERAIFIGQRTFGKGSVQQVKMLQSGLGALKITNAYYYLPNGRNIHRREDDEVWGVDPRDGYFVTMTPEQIREMIKIRRSGDILRQDEASPDTGNILTTVEWVDQKLADPQLASALTAINGKLEQGEWPQVGESGADAIARRSRRANLTRQRDLLTLRLEEVREELAELDQPETDEATDEVTEPIADNGDGPLKTDEQPTPDNVDPENEPAAQAPESTPDPVEAEPVAP